MNKYKKGDILVGIKEKNGEGYIKMLEILKVYKRAFKSEEQYLARDLCGNYITVTNDHLLNLWGMLKTTIYTLPEYAEGRLITHPIQEDVGEVLKKHFYKPSQRQFKKK